MNSKPRKITRPFSHSTPSCFLKGSVPGNLAGTCYWFIFKNNELLIKRKGPGVYLPNFDYDQLVQNLPSTKPIYLGQLDGVKCFCLESPTELKLTEGMEFLNLREIYRLFSNDLPQIANYAVQILNWDKNFKFCGRCGSRTVELIDERAKRCPKCQFINYPRLSPAIIVAVIRGDEILLARPKRFKSKMYSVLAGFVEPGETLEECVKREVLEEVNIVVNNIRYFGSQPWPFPDSLMIGFTAEYQSGKINIDQKELLDADWFRASELPEVPTKISIAGHMIDWFIRKHSHSKK